MEIEKQRGISVTSSAMQFEYDGFRINILDTPGHQDFSEDTYRVLVAADSAVMLLDASRGVEEQTKKLFKVCRMRGIPIFTFVNKMDRAAKDPFALMEELEQVLGIRSCPVNWPIGVDGDFQGVFHRDTRTVELYFSGDHGRTKAKKTELALDDPALPGMLEGHTLRRLKEEPSCWTRRGPLRPEGIARRPDPVFVGAAVANFGVEPVLNRFLRYTLPPTPRESNRGAVPPENPEFSGFVFKIQANMNPAHRDRLAFVRVVSGVFRRDMFAWHSGQNKQIQLKAPQQFMADERAMVETAYPATSSAVRPASRLGDTLSESTGLRFSSIPCSRRSISPACAAGQHEAQAVPEGLSQLSEEGAIQPSPARSPARSTAFIVRGRAAVRRAGLRLKNEYGAELLTDRCPGASCAGSGEPQGRARIEPDIHHRQGAGRPGHDVLFSRTMERPPAEERNRG